MRRTWRPENTGDRNVTISSVSGVVSWGTGMNLIKIDGLLTEKELPAIFGMMDGCLERAEVAQGRRNIGFYLDCDGGPHKAIKQLVAQIKYFREHHEFHFYVEVKRAASSAMLIVALADTDKRTILSDGEAIIHNGDIRLTLPDFMENGQLYSNEPYKRLKDAVEFYRENLWSCSPTRFDYEKLDAKQKARYTASGLLHLSAEECVKQFDFKLKS